MFSLKFCFSDKVYKILAKSLSIHLLEFFEKETS